MGTRQHSTRAARPSVPLPYLVLQYSAVACGLGAHLFDIIGNQQTNVVMLKHGIFKVSVAIVLVKKFTFVFKEKFFFSLLFFFECINHELLSVAGLPYF